MLNGRSFSFGRCGRRGGVGLLVNRTTWFDSSRGARRLVLAAVVSIGLNSQIELLGMIVFCFLYLSLRTMRIRVANTAHPNRVPTTMIVVRAGGGILVLYTGIAVETDFLERTMFVSDDVVFVVSEKMLMEEVGYESQIFTFAK
jgi:hypothetical protein